MEAVTSTVPPQLPARLLRFFAKYPPQLYGAKFTGETIPLTRQEAKLRQIAKAEQHKQNEAFAAERREAREARKAQIEAARTEEASKWVRIKAINAGQVKAPKVKTILPMSVIMQPYYISLPQLERLRIKERRPKTKPKQTPRANRKKSPPNPFLPRRVGNKTRGADISLRRQAELVKIANQHGVEALLPVSRKSTAFKQEKLLKYGLRVRGTGEGQKVKGHKWERNYGAKMEERYKAIQNMPALIRDWEARGHGRGLKREQYPKVKMP